MARFLVTNGEQFTPFSYEELVKPVQNAAAAQAATQDAYDTLTAETSALRNYISGNSDDVQAREMYNNYVARLESLQNNLWSNGFGAQARRELSAARAGYASDITRIAQAIKTRQERSAEYWKTKHDHPELITGADPGKSGLDNYLTNDLYGADYFTYDGKDFANMVGAEAKARVSEMLKDPHLKDVQGLEGYLMAIFENGFTNSQVDDAYKAIMASENGNDSLLDSLDYGAKILADVLKSNLDSTGAKGKVDQSEYNRLINYGKVGLAQAVGEQKPELVQDLKWKYDQELALAEKKHQDKLAEIAARVGAKNGSGNSEAPSIATLRGNELNGIADKKQMEEFTAKKNVLEFLSLVDDLKKTRGAMRKPDGTLIDPVSDGLKTIAKDKKTREIYESIVENATGSKQTRRFLADTDLGPIIDSLRSEVDQMETNDHLYSFDVLPSAASNMARNVFKTNIGELSTKTGKKVAESVAHYSNRKSVSASDLMKLLESENLKVGFDARNGKITLQRTKSDDSSSAGKYDDRIIFLDTDTVLSGTSAYVNLASLLYAYNSLVPEDVSSLDKKTFENMISALALGGRTVDMREFAKLISKNYTPLMKNGTDAQKELYNSLVETFAVSLFDNSNTPWAPNPYKEGWSAKTGGEGMSDIYDILYDED